MTTTPLSSHTPDTTAHRPPGTPSDPTASLVQDSLVARDQTIHELVGPNDSLLRHIMSLVPATIHLRGNRFTITGGANEVATTTKALTELLELVEAGTTLDTHLINQTVTLIVEGTSRKPSAIFGTVTLQHRGKTIKAKTLGQRHYLETIAANTVTFGFGPAGTGKTYLAMAMAVVALRDKHVSRIILTRPAVEAGESLGFLPGTLAEKIDPYLRPLFDALHDMMDPDVLAEHLTLGTIEVAPLAYMRGRTLNDAFVILDEAQNTTAEQMKMFLTRIGFGTKVVVTGDKTQVDLPGSQRSSLRTIQRTLEGIDGLAFCELGARDVVRHKIVQDIVLAYERADHLAEQARAERQGDSQGGAEQHNLRTPESAPSDRRDPECGATQA